MRIYKAVEENLDAFNAFFNERLLPVQVRHGARLVGRWQTDDARVVAIWEYDDRAAYERIQAAVRDDPESVAAQEFRKTLPRLAYEQEEVFMVDTVMVREETEK